MEKKVIIKSNDLIEASYKLTIGEQKLILYMASMIKPYDKEFKKYKIKIADFMDVLAIENKSKYSDIAKITKNLMDKSFTIKKEESFLNISWLSSAEYFYGKGFIELEFSPKLKPYLLQLRERFTKFYLKNVFQFRSVYSVRIYELLKQYETIGERIISLDEIKKLMRIEDNYKRYNDFKRFVLLQAQKELKEFADIYFEFEEIKTGRKVKEIKFKIKKRKINQPIPEQNNFSEKLIEAKDYNLNFSEDEQSICENIVKQFYISKEKVFNLINKYGIDKIRKTFEYIKENETLNNPAGFFIKALEDDYKILSPEEKELKQKITQLKIEAKNCLSRNPGFCGANFKDAKKKKNEEACYWCRKFEKLRLEDLGEYLPKQKEELKIIENNSLKRFMEKESKEKQRTN